MEKINILAKMKENQVLDKTMNYLKEQEGETGRETNSHTSLWEGWMYEW